MTEDRNEEILSLLRELRDGQRLHLERQAESLALQKEQFRLLQEQ